MLCLPNWNYNNCDKLGHSPFWENSAPQTTGRTAGFFNNRPAIAVGHPYGCCLKINYIAISWGWLPHFVGQSYWPIGTEHRISTFPSVFPWLPSSLRATCCQHVTSASVARPFPVSSARHRWHPVLSWSPAQAKVQRNGSNWDPTCHDWDFRNMIKWPIEVIEGMRKNTPTFGFNPKTINLQLLEAEMVWCQGASNRDTWKLPSATAFSSCSCRQTPRFPLAI